MAEVHNILVHATSMSPAQAGSIGGRFGTFRNHTVAAMFCLPCEHAWTEPTSHPGLQNLGLDRIPYD
jgi:hypothetical protein